MTINSSEPRASTIRAKQLPVPLTAAMVEAFIAEHAAPAPSGLAPEMTLHLAIEPLGIWQIASAARLGHPFWAFAWPGGQALARFLLDHPEHVAGRRVLDLGCGSALAGLAAVRAGALQVVASDIDPVAAAVAGLNARLAECEISITTEDLLDSDGDFDMILVGDVVYETALARRVQRYLARAKAAGSKVLFGDRSRTVVPDHFRPLAAYETKVAPAMMADHIELATVWAA